jgi:hypothetical protein
MHILQAEDVFTRYFPSHLRERHAYRRTVAANTARSRGTAGIARKQIEFSSPGCSRRAGHQVFRQRDRQWCV